MPHLTTSDDKFRDGYRAYLITRRDPPSEYRFGRTQGKRVRVRARNALRHFNGFLQDMIKAIANSKLRRMERELELRGIRLDRANNDWATRNPGSSRVRND
jgi:hypothetical protein